MVLIDGLVRILEQRIPRLPRAAAMITALIILAAVFAASALFIADNAGGFLSELMTSAPKMGARIVKLAASLGIHTTARVARTVGHIDPSSYLGAIAASVQNLLSNAVFVLIYLGFLLASRHGFRRKIVTLFPSHDQRDRAREMFEHIRTGIERYVWVQTVTGAIIAAAAWAIMAAVKLDNAVFWAFFIFITSYVPMVGAAAGILAPAAFALLQFSTAWQAIAILVGLEVVFFIVGNVILPRMQGRSLNLDPVVILLSLAFWGALWGLTGAFLSSPLTVMAMIILSQFPSTRWIGVLLSDDGDPARLERAGLEPGRTRHEILPSP